jgi:hypothetical protein
MLAPLGPDNHMLGGVAQIVTHDDEMMSRCLQPKRMLFIMLNHICPTIHSILLWEVPGLGGTLPVILPKYL